jgi:DNA-directed RNA polymerase subunit H (RpoH/RPB5)
MSNRKSNNEHFIDPDPFDLAIIEVVELLYSKAPTMKLLDESIPDKKDILKKIGITPEHWPQMMNHQRHVSTKRLKQEDIVKKLKESYWVNPDYIWRYPQEKEMFIVTGIFKNELADEGLQLPSSAKLLKKELIQTQKDRDKLQHSLDEKNSIIKSLKEDLENMRLLVRQLKSDKSAD